MSLDLSFDALNSLNSHDSINNMIAKCLEMNDDTININLDGINVNCEADYEDVLKNVSKNEMNKIVNMGYKYVKYSELILMNSNFDINSSEIFVKNIRYNNKLQKWVISKSKLYLEDILKDDLENTIKKCYYFYKNKDDDSTRQLMEHLLNGLDNNTITFTFR